MTTLPTITLWQGDCREVMRRIPDDSVNCVVTSPPYFHQRDYGVPGQIGLESTPDAYAAMLAGAFAEVRRVLREDGTLWVVLGDSMINSGGHTRQGDSSKRKGRSNVAVQHARKGVKPIPELHLKTKDLIGIPWRVAFALQARGWYLRQEIIWHKPNATPESVTDRPSRAHETIFLLSKSQRYRYDRKAIREPAASKDGDEDGMRNSRSVWTIPTVPMKEAHFAVYPPELPRRCILAGCPEGGTVLDPFAGAGTTLVVAQELGRNSIGIELNPGYLPIIEKRIKSISLPLLDRGMTETGSVARESVG